MTNGTKAIEVNRISKWYGDFQAVKDLSFDVHEGEIFALLGPNGAGKSTSIRMILDIIKPDTGSISVLGGSMNDSIKNRLGYLPEERGLYKSVKVIEMMAYLGRLKGLSNNDAKSKAMALLEQLELAESANNKVDELSKGMQQKVQFAVTVMHEPELIIIDEPFSGLDPVNRLLIKGLLEDLSAKGTAIVMSTHQMNQVEEMADRMLMISRGQRKLYGEVEAIRKEYAQHAIVVEGEGQWDSLPGVAGVEPVNNRNSAMLLHLKPDTTMDSVLAAIAQAPSITVERFERAIPTLDEIFIRVAEEKINA
ncbi:MAG: ATP-binding cassette domain-containing protein [Phototrophicaceae bacterium]